MLASLKIKPCNLQLSIPIRNQNKEIVQERPLSSFQKKTMTQCDKMDWQSEENREDEEIVEKSANVN